MNSVSPAPTEVAALPTDLARLSAVDLLAGYRAGRFTPLDVVDDVIRALERTDAVCNVVAEPMYEQARADARKATADWRRGEPAGPWRASR